MKVWFSKNRKQSEESCKRSQSSCSSPRFYHRLHFSFFLRRSTMLLLFSFMLVLAAILQIPLTIQQS